MWLMTTVKSDEKTRNKLDAIVTLIAHQESDVADLLSNGVCAILLKLQWFSVKMQ